MSNSIGGSGNSLNPYYPDDQEDLAGAQHQDQINQVVQPGGENWPSPYNDPGAPPPTGVSTPSSHHSLASDAGSPHATNISPQSPSLSRAAQSSGGRRLRSRLSPNQPIAGQLSTTRMQDAQPELRSLSQTVQAQPVASSSRFVAPQQFQSHLASPSQPTASGSQVSPGTNPERTRRRVPNIFRPYPPPAITAGPDSHPATGEPGETPPAPQRRYRNVQLPQPPTNLHLPQNSFASGRTVVAMTNRQRREALTPLVLQHRANGLDIDRIWRETNLPKEDIERIFRENP